MERLMTSEEAGNILRVNPKVLERWAKAARFPHSKRGNSGGTGLKTLNRGLGHRYTLNASRVA